MKKLKKTTKKEEKMDDKYSKMSFSELFDECNKRKITLPPTLSNDEESVRFMKYILEKNDAEAVANKADKPEQKNQWPKILPWMIVALLFLILLFSTVSEIKLKTNAQKISELEAALSATPTATALPTQTQVPPTATALPTQTQVPPTATALPTQTQVPPTLTATIQNMPTQTQIVALANCALPVEGPIVFDVVNNMDVGDPGLVSTVYAWDKVNKTTAFVAIVDVANNLDFENANIQGQYAHFVEVADASCYIKDMAQKLGVTNLIYIGASAPDGFSTILPITGWKMSKTVYTEKAIEVEDATWTMLNVSNGDKHTHGDANTWFYGQLWDGKNSKQVYHFLVEPGYLVTTPKYQGTVWSVLTDDSKTLVSRFLQMTAEVVQRDDAPAVSQFYCGADTPPSGWSTSLSNWTCSKN